MQRAVLLFTILALLAGCDKGPPPAPPAPRKLIVLGTAYPLAQIAIEVGGASIQAEWIAEQGQSLEEFEPTSETRQQLAHADLIISNGPGEEWATGGSDDPIRANSIIRLDLLKSGARSDSRQIWLNPAVAKELAKVISDRLSLQRPVQASMFRQNAERFGSAVDALTRETASKSAPLRGRKVLVLSKGYSALTQSLGLVEVRPVTGSPLRLSDDDLSALRIAAKSEGASALLVEISTPPGVQQDLSHRLGVAVIPLDSLGTGAGIGRNNYLAILRYDLEQLGKIGS